MPQFPQSLAQSWYSLISDFCFTIYEGSLSLWLKGITREPKAKLVAGRGKERQTVLYRYLLSSSGLQFVPENHPI